MDNQTAAIVRVHRPELTDAERAKRMEAIKKAAANLLAAAAKAHKKEEHHELHHH